MKAMDELALESVLGTSLSPFGLFLISVSFSLSLGPVRKNKNKMKSTP